MAVQPAAAQGRWESTARLDAPRAGLAVAVLDGRLYAAGGSGLTEPRVEFESYDSELERWMPERPLVLGLERFGMAAVNGRIYAAGGYAQGEDGVGPTASMWSWSPDGGVWQSEVAMPGPKADFSLIAHEGELYAIGGTRADGAVYVFNPEETSWRTIEVPSGLTRRGAAAVVAGGQIHVIGGSLAGEVQTRVDVFDPAEEAWSRAPDLPDARSGLPQPCIRAGSMCSEDGQRTTGRRWPCIPHWSRAGPPGPMNLICRHHVPRPAPRYWRTACILSEAAVEADFSLPSQHSMPPTFSWMRRVRTRGAEIAGM